MYDLFAILALSCWLTEEPRHMVTLMAQGRIRHIIAWTFNLSSDLEPCLQKRGSSVLLGFFFLRERERAKRLFMSLPVPLSVWAELGHRCHRCLPQMRRETNPCLTGACFSCTLTAHPSVLPVISSRYYGTSGSMLSSKMTQGWGACAPAVQSRGSISFLLSFRFTVRGNYALEKKKKLGDNSSKWCRGFGVVCRAGNSRRIPLAAFRVHHDILAMYLPVLVQTEWPAPFTPSDRSFCW